MIRHVNRPRGSFRAQRRAIVTAMVLVVLVLMSALLAEFIRRAATDRRQMRTELQYEQTVRLAAAGVERLYQKRSKSPDYSGETWNLPAGAVQKTNTAEVVILINDSVATVTARYPSNSEIPSQVTRTVRLTK